MTAKIFIDQMHREVKIDFPPKRIVSLVPSQTELLYDLGLQDNIVGQTLFCIHPADKHKTKTIIGGTKKLKLELILALQPDLIIGNKEENEQHQIEYLMQKSTVWMSDIYTLSDSLEMIHSIGEIVNKKDNAEKIIGNIHTGFNKLANNLPVHNIKPKVAYFIWRKPYMVAGKKTFINDLLLKLGFENVFEDNLGRYPKIDNGDLISKNPEIILLSSEPYPFNLKHIEELQKLLPKSKIYLVNGELFSWYGSRLQHSAAYFTKLIHQIFN
jgi:ABC-type Fe3+-hydroxamate transport system substrate-binding protein